MNLFGATLNFFDLTCGSGQTFSVRGQMVNVLVFVGNLVSVVTGFCLSHYRELYVADTTHKQMSMAHDSVLKLHFQKQVAGKSDLWTVVFSPLVRI